MNQGSGAERSGVLAPIGAEREKAVSSELEADRNRARNDWLAPPLLALLAHQLSQPLTVLRGSLELALATARTAAEYREAVRQTLQPLERLFRLVRLLRELTEPLPPASCLETVPLPELMHSVVTDLSPYAESREIQLFSRLDGSASLPVAEWVGEVIHGLVGDAIQRSVAGNRVEISLASTPDGHELTISDEGPTPSDEQLRLLCDPFSQQPRAVWENLERQLEWAATLRRVEGAGGKLEVTRRRPQGRCLVLRLPTADTPKPGVTE
jgi:signal transduction histidine kinase